jgi:hypothetical protein
MKNLLPIAIVGGVILLLTQGRRILQSAANLRFEFNDIAIDLDRTRQAAFLKIYYRLRINAINPELGNITITNINLQLNALGATIGRIENFTRIEIPRQSNQVINIDANINTLQVVTGIVDLIRNRRPIPVIITGTITTNLGQVPVNYNTIIEI